MSSARGLSISDHLSRSVIGPVQKFRMEPDHLGPVRNIRSKNSDLVIGSFSFDRSEIPNQKPKFAEVVSESLDHLVSIQNSGPKFRTKFDEVVSDGLEIRTSGPEKFEAEPLVQS